MAEGVENREVCGIVSCFNTPSSQCSSCLSHYCYDHAKSHVHIITDEEAEEQEKKNEELK